MRRVSRLSGATALACLLALAGCEGTPEESGRATGALSADDPSEQGRRDLEAFDRALAGGAPGLEDEVDEAAVVAGGADEPLALPPPDDLSGYALDPLRFDFRDERELAAMEAEMKSRARSGPAR